MGDAAGLTSSGGSTSVVAQWFVTTRGTGHGCVPGTRSIHGVPDRLKKLEMSEHDGYTNGGAHLSS